VRVGARTGASILVERRDGPARRHATPRCLLAVAPAEGLYPRLLAWDQAISLSLGKPTVVEAVEVPTLEAPAEDGGDGVHRRADQEDGSVVREPVERARVGEVLEDTVVVVVARHQVPPRPAVGERRAVAGGAEEGLLRSQAQLALALLSIRLLQVAQPLEKKRRADTTHGGERVGAVELVRQRLVAEAVPRHRAARHGRHCKRSRQAARSGPTQKPLCGLK